jgi:hypothetical protein
MLAKKHKQVRHPRKEVLEAFSEAFKEIEAYFELMGFSQGEEESPEEEPPKEEPPEEEPDGQEQEEEYESDYGDDGEAGGVEVFQREDIEVSIDVFISNLVQDKVIRVAKPGAHPSLDFVFEKIFGEDHEIIELVQAFEEHIKGYFGAIGYDDMRSAYGEVLSIRDILTKEMARHAQN